MSCVRVTHIGGPTVTVEVEGWRILTDPTFDSRGRKYKLGWGTASPKVAAPAFAASELGVVDTVLHTHSHHADNLDDAGRVGQVLRAAIAWSLASTICRLAAGMREYR